MIWQVTVVCVFFPLIGQGLERGEECTNLLGEKSTCSTIFSCKAAIDAMKKANGSVLYASGTVCGFDMESLVCCRTVSDFDQTIDTIIDITENNRTDLKIYTNTSEFDAVDHIFVLYSHTTNTPTDILDTNELVSQVKIRLGRAAQINPSIAIVPTEAPQQDETTDTSPFLSASSTESIEKHEIEETEDDCGCGFDSDESTDTSTNAPFLSSLTTELIEKDADSDVNLLQENSNLNDLITSMASEEPTPSTTIKKHLLDKDIEAIFSIPTTEPATLEHSATTALDLQPITASSVDRDVLPLSNQDSIDHEVLPGGHVCGYQLKRNRMPNAVISSIDEFPWMALLRYEDEYGKDVGFKCVGTLITGRHILTSSECIATGPGTYKLKSVRLGEWSISNPTDCVLDYGKQICPDTIVNVEIEKTFSHPHGNHKLALIRMKRRVDFTDYVRPICLPVENIPAPFEKTILTSSGWGSSKYGCLLDIKSKIRLPVLPKAKCYACKEDQICVNALTKNNICKTDTGGPVMSMDKANKAQWFLEGVIPEGFFCNYQGTAGVYTRVSHHISWIISVLKGDSARSDGCFGESSAFEVNHEANGHRNVLPLSNLTPLFDVRLHNMNTHGFYVPPVPPVNEVSNEDVLPHVCGNQLEGNRMPNAVISSVDEFPWMALLRYEDDYGKDVGFKCAGTLITKRHIITSSECVATGPGTYKLKSVRLGEWSISNPTDCVFDYKKMMCPDKIVNVGIETIFSHPHGNHKLALLRLKRRVDFTDYVRPICLPVEQLPAPSEKTILTSAGWGSSKYGCLLDIKSKIRLPILPEAKCYACEEDQICVNALTNNKICKTDTGGPIMSLDTANKVQWFLEGVMPEGFSCNYQGTVGVYTRVSHHISWIISILKCDGL